MKLSVSLLASLCLLMVLGQARSIREFATENPSVWPYYPYRQPEHNTVAPASSPHGKDTSTYKRGPVPLPRHHRHHRHHRGKDNGTYSRGVGVPFPGYNRGKYLPLPRDRMYYIPPERY